MTTVLIVDDEESIRFSFSTILIDAGYEVIKAAHPVDAKAILSANRIDVAIVDRLIDSYNGMDLVEHINKVQQFCTTILISAFPSFKSASKGFGHSLFAYLQKPIKRDELCNVVEAAAHNSIKKQKIPQQEQELIQAQKMATMGLLSSGIIHDFNNFLMSINGNVDLSSLNLPDNSPALKNLEQVKEISEQGRQFAKEILSYIKKNNGKPEHVKIQSIARKAVTLLRILIPKTIIIDDIIDGNSTVRAYPAQIAQAIINLGINAMQAMENKTGKINVSVEPMNYEENHDFIRISIKDTGCGMDEETLEKIFEPFYTTQPKEIGTGIGLSTTWQIIKNHGGSITAESQPGKGSSFYIYLPIIKEIRSL